MHHRIRLVPVLLLLLGVAAVTQSDEALSPVGDIALRVQAESSDAHLLDVGLALFDPGIPEDKSTHSKLGIFPEIRKSEAQFMAVILRQNLVDSGAWGVVRVLPEPDQTAELLVTGAILRSDGEVLHLQITARDATGRPWLDREYLDVAGEKDYPAGPGRDPFGDLYRAVANDLLSARERLDTEELATVREVARLRYAASLSPEAFAGYLSRDEAGRYQLQRLPAEGDPMMDRVRRIRNQEYLFIDTLDENYADLYESMAPTYNLWRQYRREQTLYREDYRQRVASRDSRGPRGSYAAMEQTYEAYKWSKIHEQDLDELALGFNNEVTPTVLEVKGKVFRLTGTLDSQYKDWRAILREIFALETGMPAASGDDLLPREGAP
jgi:hypothetical protein